MLSIVKRVALSAALVCAIVSAADLCLAGDAPVPAAPNPQLEAANAKVQALADEFNEISGTMTSKANQNCQRCQAILRQFDTEFTKISSDYMNALSRIGDDENVDAQLMKAIEGYNAKMSALLAKYRRPVSAARPDSLCGKCNVPAKGQGRGGDDED